MGKFSEWAEKNLREGDTVVSETTANVWDIYNIVAPLVTRAVVAHAGAFCRSLTVRPTASGRWNTSASSRSPPGWMCG
jgi:hypothetical protein